MTNRQIETLAIFENITELHEALYVAGSLVEFFCNRFREEMTHDDSEGTRKRLLTTRTALVKDLEELFRVLSAIDPDLVLEWKICNCDDEDDEDEELPAID